MTFIYDIQVGHAHIEARDQKGELHAMVSVWNEDDIETKAQILFIQDLCRKWGFLLHSEPGRVRDGEKLDAIVLERKNEFSIERVEQKGHLYVYITAIDQLGREHARSTAQALVSNRMEQVDRLARLYFIEELSQKWGIHAPIKTLSFKMWARLDAGAKPYDKSGRTNVHELADKLRPKADESGYVLLGDDPSVIVAEFGEDDIVWR